MRNFMITSSNLANGLLGKTMFGPNATTVLSIIEWSVTVSCGFDFSDFPFEKNDCTFKMIATNVNVSLNHLTSFAKKLFRPQKLNYKAEGFKIEMKPFGNCKTLPVFETITTFFGFKVQMKRQVRKYLFQYFIPCLAVVIASSFSFIIPLSAIPGRVALVVTQFLTLTNLFIHHMVRKYYIYIYIYIYIITFLIYKSNQLTYAYYI